MFWSMGDFSVGTILCVILNNVDPGTAPRHVHRVRGRAADMNVIFASCRRQDILTSIVYNLKDANPDFDPNTGWMSEIKMAADMCEHVRKELDKTSSKKSGDGPGGSGNNGGGSGNNGGGGNNDSSGKGDWVKNKAGKWVKRERSRNRGNKDSGNKDSKKKDGLRDGAAFGKAERAHMNKVREWLVKHFDLIKSCIKDPFTVDIVDIKGNGSSPFKMFQMKKSRDEVVCNTSWLKNIIAEVGQKHNSFSKPRCMHCAFAECKFLHLRNVRDAIQVDAFYDFLKTGMDDFPTWEN